MARSTEYLYFYRDMLIIVVNSGIGYAGLSIAKTRPVRLHYTAPPTGTKGDVCNAEKEKEKKRKKETWLWISLVVKIQVYQGVIIDNQQKASFSLDSFIHI